MKRIYFTALALSFVSAPLQAETLHSCICSPQECKVLLAAGADVNVRDARGNTPLHRCLSAEVCRLLIAAGADVKARSNSGATPLHGCYDAEIAKQLIAAGADANALDHGGSTPLHECNDSGLCKVLLEAGAKVDARDECGHTPLHLVDDADTVQLLIAAGADINATNNYGASVLYSASVRGAGDAVRILLEKGAKAENLNGLLQEVCNMGHPAVARLLIQHGADVQTLDKDQNTLLHYACGHPNYRNSVPGLAEPRRELIRLLRQNGCSLNARNKYGNTPLLTACSTEGHAECVEELLNAGADARAVGCYLHNAGGGVGAEQIEKEAEAATALHLAAWNKAFDCIPLLLAAGADAGAVDGKGRTAAELCAEAADEDAEEAMSLLEGSSAEQLMQYALEQDNVAMVRLMHRRGIDISLKLNDNQDTPLHGASSVEMVQFLIDAGADVNAENGKGQAPLSHAVDPEVVSMLLSHGANVNDEDAFHNTPLNHFVCRRSFELVEKLQEAGAELNPQNAMPPLHVACARGHVAMVKYLLDRGADPQLKSYQGKTALDYAKEYRQKEIIKLLENK